MGKYDVRINSGEGYWGDLGIGAGISCGYVLPLRSENFLFGFPAGLGYAECRYDQYNVVNDGELAFCSNGVFRGVWPIPRCVSGCKFDKPVPFNAGLARVELNGLEGYHIPFLF